MSTTDANSTPLPDSEAEAIKNADKSLVPEQRVHFIRLLCKHVSAIAAGPTNLGHTSLMYHQIEIGDNGLLRQPKRRLRHEHIPVLKNNVDKLQKADAVVISTFLFASTTILVNKNNISMRFCIDYCKLNAVTKQIRTHTSPHQRQFLIRKLALSTFAR